MEPGIAAGLAASECPLMLKLIEKVPVGWQIAAGVVLLRLVWCAITFTPAATEERC